MWTIDKPTMTAIDTFDTCIAGVATSSLRLRLQGIRADIVKSEAAFNDAAEASKLYSIPAAGHVGTVTGKEMENLYDRHMARSKSRGRTIYEKLMISAEGDMCPFCGHRTVSTLDHSLPKTAYPALAVTPINLIPCCKDCNHAKGTKIPVNTDDQLLNAYYDDVTADRWLFAELVEVSPPAARFFVTPPDDWEDELAARVTNHFKRMGLAKLYASQAGRQFQNMRRGLGEFYDAGGKDDVRRDLERRFRSCTDVFVNCWEGALYQAAAANKWYCDGGFRS